MKKTKFFNYFLSACLIILITTGLWAYGAFGVLKNPFEMNLLWRYALVGLVLASYFIILLHFKLILALISFIIGYIAAFVIMITNFKAGMTGWGDLIGVLSWGFVLGAGVLFGWALEIIKLLLKKNRDKNLALKKQAEQVAEVMEDKNNNLNQED